MRRVANLLRKAALPAATLALSACLLVPAPVAHAGPTRAAMGRLLPEVKFDGIGLADALDFVRDVAGINLVVDWKSLAEQNINRDTPVHARLHSVSVRRVLNTLLSDAAGGDALTYTIDDGVVTVTTKAVADARLYVKVYNIEDLLLVIPDFDNAPDFSLVAATDQAKQSSGRGGSGGGGGGGGTPLFGNPQKQDVALSKDDRGQQLADLVMNTIRPEIWKEQGGTASCRYYNGNLIVSAPESVHEMLGGPIGGDN